MCRIEDSVKTILSAVDPDPDREGLDKTPARYAKFIQEFTTRPDFEPTVFAGEGYDEMIVQDAISFYSLCEHHMVPFFGTGTIAYIPDKKIIGLSKIARTLEHFSRSLQNQERVTVQVADYLQQTLEPKGVAVVLQARHLCMEMRGVRKSGAYTSTSALRGLFKKNPQTRAEFLAFRNGRSI